MARLSYSGRNKRHVLLNDRNGRDQFASIAGLPNMTIAGLNVRDILCDLIDQDISEEALPFLGAIDVILCGRDIKRRLRPGRLS
jgi:hypothetical protein